MAKLVSETYGEALFSLGMEKEIVDSLMDEIDSLWKILKENPGFSSLLIHKGRYGAIDDIFTYYTDRYKAFHKIGVAYVTSAGALTDGQKARIEKRLIETTQYSKMELHYSLDKDLIGGLVIRIGDRVVDSSIRTKLEGLQRQLMKVQLS